MTAAVDMRPTWTEEWLLAEPASTALASSGVAKIIPTVKNLLTPARTEMRRREKEK